MRTLTISPTVSSSPDSFYTAGVDLGQKRDFSVIAVVLKQGQKISLVYLKQFRLGTEYGTVIGYLRLLNERLKDLRRILIDQTGVGEVFVEDVVRAGLKNARGIMLSGPKKQDVMNYLKQSMEDGRLLYPFDREFINEMNGERFQVMETGQIKFYHPEGTHDDRLWALALAVYESRAETPIYHPVAALGKVIKPFWANPKMVPAANQVTCLTCGKPKFPGYEHVH
jgi:phage FluMu gp28-like protein